MKNVLSNDSSSAPDLHLRIEPATRPLLPAMIEFGSVHYPVGNPNLDLAYLQWLCLENPAGPAQAIVIHDQDRLVGLALLIPVVLTLDGDKKLGYFAVNVLTHPDYRNRRLFSQIIDAAKAFCLARGGWLMGHPNQAALAGWKRKEMTFRAPLVARLAGIGFGLGRRTTCLDTEQKIRMEWPPLLASLAVKAGQVRLERSVDFMLWRFLSRPDRTYRVAMDHDRQGRLAGFYVARSFKPFLDLLVDHGVTTAGAGVVSIDRPSLAMVPSHVGSHKGGEIGSIGIPMRKEMPFFATCFEGEVAGFSDITLAASDF